MIEILIVIAGAASAGGWGSLAWWTSTRHHDRRAVVLASRTVGCHPHGPKSSVRVIKGEVVSATYAAPVQADATTAPVELCPSCGRAPISRGSMAPLGPDGVLVQVCTSCSAVARSVDAALRQDPFREVDR